MSVVQSIHAGPLSVTQIGRPREQTADQPLLRAQNLGVHLAVRDKSVAVVSNLCFDVHARETLAIVGESGSGKSMSCRAILGLLPLGAKATGSVLYDGTELLALRDSQMRTYRGRSIAMTFQDAQRALNPTMLIGDQISEAMRVHERLSKATAQRRSLDLLHLLRLPSPAKVMRSYPHELSGGMRQRVMTAIAIAPRPKLLIADEPTGSLDIVTATHVIDLLRELQKQFGMALILVSHDLQTVRDVADTVLVMHAGRSVEYGRAKELIATPQSNQPTPLLMLSSFSDGLPRQRSTLVPMPASAYRSERATSPVIKVRNIVQEHESSVGQSHRRNVVRAVSNVSFDLKQGEILGIVGESGAGKSTLALTLFQMPAPKTGAVFFQDEDIAQMRGRRLQRHRREMQMVFQDPFASCDPSWRVADIVEEPLRGYAYGSKAQRRRRVEEVLELVGLPIGRYGERKPSQLSGGECQRVVVARALTVEPKVIVCDEPMSSLDAINRNRIAVLFERFRTELGIALLLISHDLEMIRQIGDRVAVMYLGRFCEIGPAEKVCAEPSHPYTVSMVSLAMSVAGRQMRPVTDNPTSQLEAPTGCCFRNRCNRVGELCATEEPQLRVLCHDHLVACHYPVREPSVSTDA